MGQQKFAKRSYILKQRVFSKLKILLYANQKKRKKNSSIKND
jgi:hypothetical protein